MKKLITAALLLLGILWIPLQAAADVTTVFEAGKYYKLKAYKDQTKYLDLVTTGKPDSGNNASVSTTDRIVYIDNVKTENGAFKVQIRATDAAANPGNFLWANSWNSRIDANTAASSFYWTVQEGTPATSDGNPVIRLYQNGPSTYAGLLGYQTTLGGNKAGCLYCNTGVSNANNVDWIVESVTIARKVNVTFNYPNGTSQVIEALEGTDATTLMPSSNHLVTFSIQETNTIVSADNATFTLNVTETLPFAVSPSIDAPIWQAFAMHASYLSSPHRLKYLSSASKIETTDAAITAAIYPDEYLWAIVGNVLDGFKIYNKAAGTGVALTKTDPYASMQDAATATQWFIKTSSTKSESQYFTMYDTGANTYANTQPESAAGPYYIKYWTVADNGSTWWKLPVADPTIAYVNNAFGDNKSVIPGLQEAYDACVADPNDYNKALALKTLATELNGLMTGLRNKGNAFVDLGFVNDNAKALWQTAAAEKTDYTNDDLNALKNAYHALIHSTCSPDSVISAGHAIRIKNANAGGQLNRYLGFNGTALSTINSATEGKRAMLMIPVATGGFKLFNEAAAKYVKIASGTDTNFPLVDSADDATTWCIEPYSVDPTSAAIQIKAINAGDRPYMHANQTNYPVRWNAGAPSSWFLEGVAGLEAAKTENLQPAYDAFRAVNGETRFGTALGQYSGTHITNAQVDALIANASASIDEVHTMAANLRAAFGNDRLNKPLAGHFYRIKNLAAASNLSASNTNDRIGLTNAQDANIIYIDAQNRFVAYPSGLVLGTFANGDDASAKYLFATDAKASTGITFTATPGESGNKFELQPSAGRYLKADNGQITAVAAPAAGTSWEFTEATWIPVFTDPTTKMATICSPVELSLTADWSTGRFDAWRITEVLPSGVALYEAVAKNIPANTPVLVKQRDTATEYYLKIEYTPTEAAPTGTSALVAAPLAIAKPEGQTIFVGGKPDGENGLVPSTADYIPGFSSYAAVAPADAPAAYKFFAGTFVPGKLYTINNTESGRGALIYAPAQADAIWTTGRGGVALDATNPNHLWGVYIDAAGNQYLYNAGAKKFATAYHQAADPTNTEISTKIDYFWGLRPVGTPVTMPENALTTRIFGGENSKGRPAGMMIINGWTCPVPGVSGVSSDTDGNRFTFTAAAAPASKQLLAEIETLFAGQAAALTARRQYPLAAETADDDETFGYYPAAVKTAFENSLGDDSEPTAKLYYKAEQACAATQSATRTGFINGHVYDLSNESGNPYHFVLEHNCASNVVTDAIATAADPNIYKWVADVNAEGQVALYQNWKAGSYYYANKAGGRRDLAWGTPDAVLFTVEHAADLGKAYLRPVTAEPVALSADAPITIAHNATSGGSITTGITSLTETAPDAPTYDLQGRRVPTSARGLLIQSGRLLRR